MNMLSRGQAMLARRLKQAASPTDEDGLVGLVYTRIDDQSHPITLTGKAWLGRTVFTRRQVSAGAGITPSIIFGDYDLLVPVVDLPAAPKKGDRLTIQRTPNEIYECMIPGIEGEPAYRYSDASHTVWRIHMKKVN